MHHRHTNRSEAGFALPVAMFFILGMFAILSIGAVAAINTQRGTVRDANSKSALAVAESGAEAALLRYGEHREAVDEELPCVGQDLSPQPRVIALTFEGASPRGGWCAPVSSTDPGRPYIYWVRPYKVGLEHNLDIVSQASIDDVTRRILQTAAIPEGTSDGWRKLGGENVVGTNYVKMWGDAQVRGGVGSNGTVHMSNSANVCGSVRTGSIPYTTDNSTSMNPPDGCAAGRPSVIGTEEHPPPVLPPDIATNNSNWRLANADPVPGNIWQRGNVSWDASTRTLTVKYSKLSLLGDAPYFLCRLVLQGGSDLSMGKSNGSVRIFFDAPEECPGNPSVPFVFANGTKITNNGYVPGLFILGSDSIATSINPAGGALTPGAVIYAPRTKFLINNDSFMTGAVIAKSIDMEGGAEVHAIAGLEDYELPIPGEPSPGGIVKDQFVECRAVAVSPETTTPAQGC